MFVEVWKSSTRWLHRTSARRPKIFHWLFHLIDLIYDPAHVIFSRVFYLETLRRGGHWSALCTGTTSTEPKGSHWSSEGAAQCRRQQSSAGNTSWVACQSYQQPLCLGCICSLSCISSWGLARSPLASLGSFLFGNLA